MSSEKIIAGLARNVIRYETKDGVLLDVVPPSSLGRALIAEKARRLHPDPIPPQKPLPDAAVPGDTFADRDDPEFKRALIEQHTRRQLWTQGALFTSSCHPVGDVDALHALYAPVVEAMGRYAHMDDDPWYNTLVYGVLADDEDIQNVGLILNRTAEVSLEGVADKMRIFRFAGSRDAGNTGDAAPSV